MLSHANTIPNTCTNSQISILFDKPSKAYFSGDVIFGAVIFRARVNQSVQTFSVYLRGEFYWTKGDTEQIENILVESSPIDYRGAGDGNTKMEFSLALRSTAPTSIRSPLGGVRYRVTAAVGFIEGGSLQTAKASEPVSVNRPLRLPESASGRQVRTVDRAGLMCCIGSISAELKVSRAFLLSGQEVIIRGSVFNGTHTRVQDTSVHLVQFLQRQKDGKKMRRIVTSLQKGAILPGKNQDWPSDCITVPPLPPSSADIFFKTWYEINLEVQKVRGKVIKLKIPVVVGNMSSAEFSFATVFSKRHGIKWKSSEQQNGADDFAPLYVTYGV